MNKQGDDYKHNASKLHIIVHIHTLTLLSNMVTVPQNCATADVCCGLAHSQVLKIHLGPVSWYHVSNYQLDTLQVTSDSLIVD